MQSCDSVAYLFIFMGCFGLLCFVCHPHNRSRSQNSNLVRNNNQNRVADRVAVNVGFEATVRGAPSNTRVLDVEDVKVVNIKRPDTPRP